MKLVKDISIGGRQVRIRGLGVTLNMPEVMQEAFSTNHAHGFNLDFLEEPSEKPTTDLSWTQLDGKASIR